MPVLPPLMSEHPKHPSIGRIALSAAVMVLAIYLFTWAVNKIGWLYMGIAYAFIYINISLVSISIGILGGYWPKQRPPKLKPPQHKVPPFPPTAPGV